MNPIAVAFVVIGAVVAAIGIARYMRFRRRAIAFDRELQAVMSKFILVVLRRAPADLQPESLESAAQAAWAERFGENADGTNYVDRYAPGVLCVLQAHGNAFMVIAFEKGVRALEPPTVFEPESASAAWNDYTHDVSVGIVYNYDTDEARLAAFVCTITAHFCDDQSLAVYHPASRRLWKVDEDLCAALDKGSQWFFAPRSTGYHL